MSTGPLTRAEFIGLFTSVNDPSYARPFLELGEGTGFEAHTQAMAQFERLSLAVDRSTQAMFILPWSGQTNEPASGARNSTVTLTFTRAQAGADFYAREVTLPAELSVAEEVIDMGQGGGVVVRTGRRYLLSTTDGIAPGNLGPVDVVAVAERPGRTYDEASPGSITALAQLGAGFENAGASVVPGTSTHALVLDPHPDVISEQMIGGYVELIAGANAGAVRRIVGYRDPNAFGSPPDGGTALLAATGVYRLATLAGQFLPGEKVTQDSGAVATCVFARNDYLVADRASSPNLVVGVLTRGLVSGAVAIISSVDQEPDLVAESRTAQWRVLDWAADFGISVTNAASPEGGRSAVLDELADEVQLGRASGEDDDSLRDRVHAPVDVVTPNAIVRAANRVLVPFGLQATIREVGYPSFRGMFYDGDPLDTDPAVAFAYDLDFDARPFDAYKLSLSLLESRAFFLVGLPPMTLGDFGIFFDVGTNSAFDAAPWPAFFDGFALSAASLRQAVWAEVYRTRAGGVGFDLVEDSTGLGPVTLGPHGA